MNAVAEIFNLHVELYNVRLLVDAQVQEKSSVNKKRKEYKWKDEGVFN